MKKADKREAKAAEARECVQALLDLHLKVAALTADESWMRPAEKRMFKGVSKVFIPEIGRALNRVGGGFYG